MKIAKEIKDVLSPKAIKWHPFISVCYCYALFIWLLTETKHLRFAQNAKDLAYTLLQETNFTLKYVFREKFAS